MEQREFDRKPLGKVELDMCFDCRAIWFDQMESAQLTPGAVIGLFRDIHAHDGQPPRPMGDAMRCPSCSDRLGLTHDFQRSNRITYYRCPRSHGRLSTFYQFLREKEFVRDLTRAEIERLKATVKQVRCSSCGAPVDLGRDAQCGYCRAPISILDTEAVNKTIAELDARERSRNRDPQAVVDGLLSGRRQPMRYPASRPPAGNTGTSSTFDIVDLVSDALDFLID